MIDPLASITGAGVLRLAGPALGSHCSLLRGALSTARRRGVV